jgi:hypothetical protein
VRGQGSNLERGLAETYVRKHHDEEKYQKRRGKLFHGWPEI